MSAIYEPKGAAREYSPLALNYIRGCDHGCVYCYVPIMMKKFDSSYIHSNVYAKEESKLLKEVESSCRKFNHSEKQVFLSFTTDPYSHFNKKTKLTRRVLLMLLENKIPVSILTKGGFNVLEDLDVIKMFGENIQVGMSLTFTDETDSRKWEKGSTTPQERFETLRILSQHGVRTWGSIEPVIFPSQSLEIMDEVCEVTNSFKIGKLNHYKRHEDKFDWTRFLNDSIGRMRMYNKLFYIKNDLYAFRDAETKLFPHERNMDFLSLPNKFVA